VIYAVKCERHPCSEMISHITLLC